jgi:acyl-CoA dehydrogenase
MDLSTKQQEMHLKARAIRVATVAAAHAEDVDKAGRFPREAIEEMKAVKLMGIMIPEELGGEGLSTSEIAEVCTIIGQACASSAMIFAMPDQGFEPRLARP